MRKLSLLMLLFVGAVAFATGPPVGDKSSSFINSIAAVQPINFAVVQEPTPATIGGTVVYEFGSGRVLSGLTVRLGLLRDVPVVGDVWAVGVAAVDDLGERLWGGFGVAKEFQLGPDIHGDVIVGAVVANRRPVGLFIGASIRLF